METRIVDIGGKPYTIREDGAIYKIRGSGFKVPFPDKSGYLKVGSPKLDKSGYDNHFVHKLVYLAFCGEIPEGLTVDHIDNDKLNNHYSNLQLLSRGDNSVKGNAKVWKFRSPENEVVEIYNLEEFCRQNKLHAGHMRYVHNEKPSHNQHKGWRKYYV